MFFFRVVREADSWLAKRGREILASCATAEEAIAVAIAAAALVRPSKVFLHDADGGRREVCSNL